MQEKAKAQLEAVKAKYTGKGETLHRRYSFTAYVYDKDAKLVQYAGRWNTNNQRTAIQQAAWRLYSGYFKRFRDYSWMIINTQKGVVASSDDLKTPIAKKILGYAVYHRHFDLTRAEPRIAERYLPSRSEKRFYYALARSTNKPEQVKLVNLTRNAGTARQKYNDMCASRVKDPAEYNVCVYSSTG